MLFSISLILKPLILPPGLNLILFLIGYITYWKKPVIGKFLLFFSIISLWALSTPIVSYFLINGLQHQSRPIVLDKLMLDKQSSIAVLEAGLNLESPEYGVPIVSEATLSRLRYAAFLHKKIKAPILVSGNDPTHSNINQADYMAQALHDYFNVDTKWKEDKGYNTAQEAIYTTDILKQAGIKKMYLVTAAYHMPRSMLAFLGNGLEVIPAPTGYIASEFSINITTFLPSSKSLAISSTALHEYIGIGWYFLKRKINRSQLW